LLTHSTNLEQPQQSSTQEVIFLSGYDGPVVYIDTKEKNWQETQVTIILWFGLGDCPSLSAGSWHSWFKKAANQSGHHVSKLV